MLSGLLLYGTYSLLIHGRRAKERALDGDGGGPGRRKRRAEERNADEGKEQRARDRIKLLMPFVIANSAFQ